jgi:hypothetical protein
MRFMAVLGMVYGATAYCVALIPVVIEISSTRNFALDRYAGWIIFLLSAILWKVSSKKNKGEN